MYYFYVLICFDNSLYTGFTENLEERFRRHENGQVPATKPRLPIKLIFYCGFINKYKALQFEKYLKSGSGRAFAKKHLV
jgi:predicted GIY-YIG superfamily endonuclease